MAHRLGCDLLLDWSSARRQTRSRRGCSSLAALLVLCGCAGEVGSDEVAFDRVFVREETIRLSSSEQPIGLPEAVLPWGDQIAVLDGLQGNVKVFTRQGEWSGTLGRPGDGPGEFRYPTRAAVSGDGTLHVFDAGQSRISAFSRDGSFQTAQQLALPYLADVEPLDGPGRLVAATRGPDGDWMVRLLGPGGEDAASLHTIPAAGHPYEFNASAAGLAVVGSTVAISSATDDTLRLHDLRTRVTRRIPVGGGFYEPPAWPRRPFPREREQTALTEWMNDQMWTGDVLPLGGDWVAVPLLRSGQPGTTPAHRYAITSTSGASVVVTTPVPALLRPWSPGRVAALRIDDQGNVSVDLYRFVSPSEGGGHS